MEYKTPSLKAVYIKEWGGGGVGKMAVVGYEYGTMVIEVCLYFNFAVVFSSTYFLFLQVQSNY